MLAVVTAALALTSVGPSTDGVVPAGPVATSHGERPNVVLIVTDDQRADTLPAMQRVNALLVAKGVRFSNGMVPTALCCPSRATILTGLYAHHTRVFGNGDTGGSRFGGWAQFHRRGMEYRTLATALSARGYRTGFFGKYLNDFAALTTDGYTPPGWDGFTAFKRSAYFGYRLTDGTYHGNRPRDYSTDVLARRASRFVRSTPADEPLFVMFAPYGVHSPFVPAPRHADNKTDLPAREAAPAAAPAVDGKPRPRWSQRRAARQHSSPAGVRNGQLAALLSVDQAVAKLVRVLRREKRVHDTLFVFMSDNGYLWGEHGMVGKDVPYDAATRVPLVVRWDGHTDRGTIDERLALNVDIAGTIAGATGAAMTTDGLDLLGRATRPGFPVEAMPGYRNRPAYCGWRTRSHLYVRYANGRSELFDYRTDPGEQHDLAGSPAVAELESRMRTSAIRHCSPEPPGFDW